MDMLFTQPVVYELEHIHSPTLLIVGGRDRTAPFRQFAPPDAARRMGDYPQLAREAVRRIPNARLIEFADLGHAPQLQDPQRFNDALLQAIAPPAAAPAVKPAAPPKRAHKGTPEASAAPPSGPQQH